ncbi:hypothetical protein COCON_G00092440 [Conger conger]|uniref:Uncharacterized protein n=1 Tax=Conger conger TaxID=82655 RepID=A0A9Q1DLM7_CONCO|nr:hypothetical protein COCON_G00092440 [Conger conger]
MIFFLSFFVGYFCLSHGQTTPDLMGSTTEPMFGEELGSGFSPFPVSLPVVIGLRLSVKSSVELNSVTIERFLQQIMNSFQLFNGTFEIAVKNITRITPD